MRAVVLGKPEIQNYINQNFVPLKVKMTYPPKMPEFPLNSWPSMWAWNLAYTFSPGSGFTGCSVISPDLKAQYGHTGEAQVWALFEAVGYRPDKFLLMLKNADTYAANERSVQNDPDLNAKQRDNKIAGMRWKMWGEVDRFAAVDGPPAGFKIEHAMEIFRKTGDLPKGD